MMGGDERSDRGEWTERWNTMDMYMIRSVKYHDQNKRLRTNA
jgi:hypothetical protein